MAQSDMPDDDVEDVAVAAVERDKPAPRGQDISKRKGVRDKLLDVFKEVEEGYRDQWNRSNEQQDYWDIYNCKLTGKQFYSGNSKIFVPIIHNAVNARKTRFTNQIFPQSGRYVETTSSDGTKPDALSSLLEFYVRKAKLRTKVMPALCKAGDIEGQYNIYVSWNARTRHVTWRAPVQPPLSDGETPNPAAEPVMDIKHEEVEEAHPEVEVLADSDVLVLPTTADTLEDAIAEGGSVTILRRWGPAKIQQLIDDGAIREDVGKAFKESMSTKSSRPEDINQAKKNVDAAGIKAEKGRKYGLVYETFTLLEIKGEKQLCQAFYGGDDRILGARRNPLWCDRLPMFSVPVEKVAEVFKGRAKVGDCADMQYAANDAINEAWDSAGYSLMPVVMTDPEKNPRIGSMVMSMAAVWETSPKDTQALSFPSLWEKGFELVSQCKAEVAQTLSVSPAALTGGASGKAKPSQAEVAQEQQIDILTTADAVVVLEEGILTPMLTLFIELDHQYRDDEITVRAFGEMGLRAEMEKIPPVQMDKRYQFRWFGVEQARNAQQIQQQIAAMNVLRGIPPQQLNGYQLNLVPVVTQLVENTFGPRLAPLIFMPPETQLPVPVDTENLLLAEGFEVPTHQMDDDQMHLQAHMSLLQQLQMTGGGKNSKKIQTHIMRHVQQGQAKQMAAMQAQMAPPGGAGMPGVPGGAVGGQPRPGVAGTPRIGAQPMPPRGGQGPPGMIHQDQLQDPRVMPRLARA